MLLWLWLFAVLVGSLTMIVAIPVFGFGPFTWGLGCFAMSMASWPWMRRRSAAPPPLWRYTLWAGLGALVVGVGVKFSELEHDVQAMRN